MILYLSSGLCSPWEQWHHIHLLFPWLYTVLTQKGLSVNTDINGTESTLSSSWPPSFPSWIKLGITIVSIEKLRWWYVRASSKAPSFHKELAFRLQTVFAAINSRWPNLSSKYVWKHSKVIAWIIILLPVILIERKGENIFLDKMLDLSVSGFMY